MNATFSEKLKMIYDRLADDESRSIFTHRLQYFLSGDNSQISSMVYALNQKDRDKNEYSDYLGEKIVFQIFEDYKKAPKPIILYGAGQNAPFIKIMLEQHGLSPSLLVDRNIKKQKQMLHGLQVISPEELIRNHKDSYVIITTLCSQKEVYSFLMSNGLMDKNLYLCPLTRQYFGQPFLPPVANEVYVDAGCCSVGTIKDFICFCNKDYKKIYGIEPEPAGFESTKSSVCEYGYENVYLVNKGCWSSDTVLHFDSGKGSCSKIKETGSIKVPVTTIDNIVGDDKVTLIKMDIEGAELEALIGAENTIKTNQPRLAICIYHKAEDVLEIPLYILSLVPSYIFYIRHHTMGKSETVLYALPQNDSF